MSLQRRIAAVLILCLLLPLCACAGRSPYALTVDGSRVGKEVYGYYLAQAQNDASSDAEKEAAAQCARYVAGSALIAQYGVTLSAEQKVAVSAKLKGTWQYFADDYRHYGVSKQTLCEMLEYEKLLENLTIAMFEKKHPSADTQKTVERFFYQNYVGAKMIRADFTGKDGKPLSRGAQSVLTKKFTEMRNMVRRGSTLASAAGQYPDIAEYDDAVVNVIGKADDAYPDGMFENVLKMEIGSTQVFRFSNGIYLIQREDIAAEPALYYERYRSACILKMYGDAAEKEINTLAQSYKTEYNVG